ncbi:MAG: aspartate aminotransferase family protein [Colwellia sp.]|nr:aspartate aminotransferase family protein [Colwellia sp.]
MNYSPETNQRLIAALTQQFDTFHSDLANRDVASKKMAIPYEKLPVKGIDFDRLNEYISENIQPNLSASNGGRYWGFVTGGANPVATFADWLVTTFNQNVSKGGDSIASFIEQQTLTWLCELFELPTSFKGIFTTGATAANLLAAFTARQYAGDQQGIDVAKNGLKDLDVSIFSATPHASMIKSLGMAGLGQNSWQKITCKINSEAMDVNDLAQALLNSKSKSNIVIASAATVTGTDYDDLVAVAQLCKKHNAWLHVDAAFGIFDRLLAGKQGKTRGIELADSITLDCHKWLNVPYDCGVFLTQHQRLLKDSCHVDAPYLASDNQDVAFLSLGIENSRRFRAFPVWATLMFYGKEGIKDQINRNVDQAKQLAEWIDESTDYILVKPCELNVVLFKPNQENLGLTSQECMDKLNKSGQVFLTPGSWQGEAIIRAALSNWATTDDDIKLVIKTLSELA